MKLYLTMFLVWLIALSLSGKNERVNNVTRVPVISIQEAIKLTEQYHDSSAMAAKPIYIDFAEYYAGNQKPYWKLGYRLKEYESGHFLIKLFMDGKIESDVIVKDG